MTALYILVYVSVTVFLAACIVRAVRYARLPLNLRWELYPIPHQDAAHAGHGGSYFEELDWWTKPRRRNLFGEITTMAAEILLLRALFDHNRRLWCFSYPFHLGLYLLILTALASVGAAIASRSVPALAWIGFAACLLAIFGASGLFVSRLRDPELRAWSAPADFFNLAFFAAAAAMLAFSKLAAGPGLVATFRALLTFDTTFTLPAPQSAAIGLAALLIAYIPLTHMSHFIGKYFTYHAIRWSDRPAPAIRGLQRRIAAYLAYKPTWSASHMSADGAAPWSEIVAKNPTEPSK